MAAEPATLLAVLNKAADYFKAKGVPDHRLDAQLLLGRVLGMRRLDLYMNFDRPLDETELARYRELVKRRGRREPLQHLLGETPFRDLTLKSDARALIPRPETELLVDLARQAAGSRPDAAGRAGAALDVGVGAGPIYLSLLKELPGWRVCGVDLSRDCLDLTRENAERNGLTAEHLCYGDAFAPFGDQRWDLVVSNPPYVGQGEMAGLEPEVRDFDPALALVGGPEGWEFAARLMAEAFPRLNPGGSLLLEIGIGQSSILKDKSRVFAWQGCRTALDYQGVERFLILHK